MRAQHVLLALTLRTHSYTVDFTKLTIFLVAVSGAAAVVRRLRLKRHKKHNLTAGRTKLKWR